MSITSLVDIPEDLAAEAAQVEGLPQRLIFWLRAEITQDKKRKSRHSAQAKEIVSRARERAQKEPMTEEEKEAARSTFVERYEQMLAGLKNHD